MTVRAETIEMNNCLVTGPVRVEWGVVHSSTSNNISFHLESASIDRSVLCHGISFVSSLSTPLLASNGLFIHVPYYFFCNHINSPKVLDTFGGYYYTTCIVYRNQTHFEECQPSLLGDIIFNSKNSWLTQQEQWKLLDPVKLTTKFTFNNTQGLDKNMTIQIVFKQSTGLQEFIKFSRNESFSELCLLEEQQFRILQLFNLNKFNGWDPECNSPFFQTRPFYIIWKAISCFIVAIVCIGLLVMLVRARKNRYIQSRFLSPYFSTVLFFLASALRFGFVVASSDNYYMNLLMTAIIIYVFSLYTLQTIRYFLSRWFYKRYYESERKKKFWFSLISSKITYIICSIALIILEVVLIYFVSAIKDIGLKNDVLDYLTIAAFAVMMFLTIGSTILYLLANRDIFKQLGSFTKVVKWYFIYDDTFKYHAEFLAVIIMAIAGLIFFLLSFINGSFMSGMYFLPVSNMMASHIIGYSLYGISKTVFEVCLVCFEPGYLILIYLYESKQPAIEFDCLKQLKVEMEMFLAHKVDDVLCVDIMKRFLAAEFRAEVLEIYLFISKNTNFTEQEITSLFPTYALKNIMNAESTSFKLKESLESNLKKLERAIEESRTLPISISQQGISNTDWKKKFTSLVTFQMIDSFSRLKQTPTYQINYVEMKEFENQFVSKVLGRVGSNNVANKALNSSSNDPLYQKTTGSVNSPTSTSSTIDSNS